MKFDISVDKEYCIVKLPALHEMLALVKIFDVHQRYNKVARHSIKGFTVILTLLYKSKQVNIFYNTITIPLLRKCTTSLLESKTVYPSQRFGNDAFTSFNS